MKKIIVIACVVVFVIGIVVVSFAQDSNKMDKPMMGKGMIMGKSGMVATQDGGVIVMVSNKLYKYDKDLNLVKEAEVKMDMEGMQKMMMEMKEKCPMSHEMMERCGMMEHCGMMCEEKEEHKEPVKSTKP